MTQLAFLYIYILQTWWWSDRIETCRSFAETRVIISAKKYLC